MQVAFTMGQHGMAIDPRHTMLLADCMTYKVPSPPTVLFLKAMTSMCMTTRVFSLLSASHRWSASCCSAQGDVAADLAMALAKWTRVSWLMYASLDCH